METPRNPTAPGIEEALCLWQAAADDFLREVLRIARGEAHNADSMVDLIAALDSTRCQCERLVAKDGGLARDVLIYSVSAPAQVIAFAPGGTFFGR